MVDTGLADADSIDLDVIRDRHAEDPETIERLMLDNDRVVFFEIVPASTWPRASTGVRLVPRHTAAVDPNVIPLGSVLLIEGDDLPPTVVVAVDIGGAIRSWKARTLCVNSTFLANVAGGNGGVYNGGKSVFQAAGCAATNNTANSDASGVLRVWRAVGDLRCSPSFVGDGADYQESDFTVRDDCKANFSYREIPS